MRVVTLAVVFLAAATLLPIEADAGGRSGGRGHSSSGRSSGHHHFHGGTRVFIGTGIYYGYPYYYPYYPVGVPLYPPAPADPYWYYCRAANAYYPYVQACPGGWERYLPGTPLG